LIWDSQSKRFFLQRKIKLYFFVHLRAKVRSKGSLKPTTSGFLAILSLAHWQPQFSFILQIFCDYLFIKCKLLENTINKRYELLFVLIGGLRKIYFYGWNNCWFPLFTNLVWLLNRTDVEYPLTMLRQQGLKLDQCDCCC